MTDGAYDPCVPEVRSEFDRRAIGAVAHLLVAGVWLERLLGTAPMRLRGVLELETVVPGLLAAAAQKVFYTDAPR
jgi:hypothetical protein